jgi:hypothetical protein
MWTTASMVFDAANVKSVDSKALIRLFVLRFVWTIGVGLDVTTHFSGAKKK